MKENHLLFGIETLRNAPDAWFETERCWNCEPKDLQKNAGQKQQGSKRPAY